MDKTPVKRTYPVTVSLNDEQSPIEFSTFPTELAVNMPYTITGTLKPREQEPFRGNLTLTVALSSQTELKAEVSILWGTTCILTNYHTNTVPYFLVPRGQASRRIQIGETVIVKSKNADGWYEIYSAGLIEPPLNSEETVWIDPNASVTVSPQAYCDRLIPVEATPTPNDP